MLAWILLWDVTLKSWLYLSLTNCQTMMLYRLKICSVNCFEQCIYLNYSDRQAWANSVDPDHFTLFALSIETSALNDTAKKKKKQKKKTKKQNKKKTKKKKQKKKNKTTTKKTNKQTNKQTSLPSITKACLFKYVETFTSKNRKFSDKKLWNFS